MVRGKKQAAAEIVCPNYRLDGGRTFPATAELSRYQP